MKNGYDMRLNSLSFIFLFLYISIHLSAQPWTTNSASTDEQLASQYLLNKEYDKAIVYYEKLFSKKNGIVYYNQYLTCMLKLKSYDKAEKVLKKLNKQYPDDLKYIVALGSLYKETGNSDKVKREYERAIRQLNPAQQQIFELANLFLALQEWDYALATYQKGRKLLRGFYPFNAEIAEVYQQKGDIEGMVSEYFDLLEENDDFLQTVQNGLQPSFGEDKDEKKNEIIKIQLLKRIQQYPDKTIFSELLIWFFIQEKNFDRAFVQAKALDKRMNEEGERMMLLGQLCVSNENYEVAVKCFQYVIEKGKGNYYYVNSKIELLDAMYKKITTKFSYTQNDLIELEKNYIATLDELDKYNGTTLLIKNLAHLQAFYLNKTNEAIALLQETIELPNINEKIQAECKIELGDIFLMTKQIWDASLLYSQVAFDFKHEPLGNEAKFRNAKLSYYNNEFLWAQAQLDVLKAATEKLIANDAMELSLLISDNLSQNPDSLPLCFFARADLLMFRNQNDKALITFDSIAKYSPGNSLSDDVLYKKYHIKIKQGKYTEAAEHLQNIIDNYSYDILADDALFKLAELNEYYLNNIKKAKDLYEQVLLKYPGSLYTVEARKRFRRLRGDSVEY
ncbi:MAG: tetratricopeptide repeat protein [Bacteroidota bacterium]